MDVHRLREILALSHEVRAVEFKGPCGLKEAHPSRKIIRAVLSMANTRGGGEIVVGVDDNGVTLIPAGLSDVEVASWSMDDFADQVQRYSDPSVSLTLDVIELESKKYVGIDVDEFDSVPILCKRDYPDVLRRGACYVRSRTKPETAEVASFEGMRELLDLATEKALATHIGTTRRAGGQIVPLPGESHQGTEGTALAAYDAELAR